MRNIIASLLAVICLSCSANTEGFIVQEEMIKIEIICETGPNCTYPGDDILIKVRISNQGKATIGLPISFLRKSGPIVEIIDNQTGRKYNSKRNLADFELMNKIHEISPGQHEDIDWVVFQDEIEQFQHKDVDVTVRAEIKSLAILDGVNTEIDASGSTVIRGKSAIYTSDDKP